MPEPTSDGGSVTQTPPQPVTGTPASGGATPSQASLTLEEASKRIAELEHSHKNATEELERHRKNAKRLSDLEKAEADRQASQLSETERKDKQLAELQAALDQERLGRQELLIKSAVTEQAVAQKFVYPELAYLLAMNTAELETDESGKPTNADKVIGNLRKNYPRLFEDEPSGPAPQQRAPAVPAMNPGRSSIQQPGQNQPGRIPGWHEVYKRP